ncbi:MAG: hypothetical protein IPK31_09140 [Chitinophagaceae bacterium]|nr:hypothetical protein [Chitinophagaceae bacterium]
MISIPFILYHGGLLIGYPEQENNKWYIVNRNQSNKESTAGSIGHLILPEQIDKIEPIYPRNKQRVTPNPPSYVIEGSPKTKIMVIFGAGASLDYTFDQEDSVRPPLGNDLFSDTFSNLISQFKGVESLSSQILQSKNIEIFFQEQWNNIKNTHNPKLLNKLIDTQYYLHYLFRHLSTTCRNNRKNNYSSFFQSLENYLITKGWDEKAMIVSFNYDTLIENALSHSLDYTFTDFGDYINYKNSRFLLFKPHGSWNWVRYISEKFLDSINFNYVEKNL